MTRNLSFVVMLLMLSMSISGIASAEEKMVSVKELGMVSESTAKVFEILKARRERALAGAVKSTRPTPQPVMVAKPVEPEKVFVAEEKVSQETNSSSAPVSQVVSNYTANPVKVEKKPHTFDEYTLYAGVWHAMQAKTKGVWTLAEWTHWWAGKENPQNFGLGLTLKADKGWGQNGSHWGYIAPGLNLDYYNAFSDENDILAKFRPMYRFGENRSGFMPGGYLQLSHILGRNDKLIASADGQYFRNDSYLGLALMWEHRFNKDLKVRFGPFAGINFMQSETIIGIGPEIVLDLYNRFEIGLSANFAKGGPFIGAFAGYKVNTDLRMVDANLRERSVELKQNGTMPEVNAGEVVVKKTATGDYATMPVADSVTVSAKTLDEQ